MAEGIFRFSNLSAFSELTHGLSNRTYGDMRFGGRKASEVIQNRELFLKQLNINLTDLIVPRLAHGTDIKEVDQKDRGRGSMKVDDAITAIDGLICSEPGVFLMVTVADCLPIFIYDPVEKRVGIFHAGWRGIIGQIVPKAVQRFQSLGSSEKNLVVGVGPGICQKHFVVKKDVLKHFLDYYPSATMVRNHDGYVDLKKAVKIDLNKSGIPAANTEISQICTVCENGTYGSYRKEGEDVPAAGALIGLK